MKTSTDQIHGKDVVRYSTPAKTASCLSCGANGIKPPKRYCAKACRQKMNWVLSLSQGLLTSFNTRYAAFSFTNDLVILDILSVWSTEIARLVCRRANGNKPAEDLKQLILQSGREWHHMVNGNKSKSFASLHLIKENYDEDIDPDSIKPDRKDRPRLSKYESDCLKTLNLNRKDLSSDCSIVKIKSAYRRMAKIHHPDAGGDNKRFRQLNEAQKQMLLWTENPQYTSRRALHDCWSYNGYTHRWSPPL